MAKQVPQIHQRGLSGRTPQQNQVGVTGIASLDPGTGQSCRPKSLWSICRHSKITDPAFADDAIIFAESLEVLEAIHGMAESLGFQVSWPKTKVQVFIGLLDEKIPSIHVCGEDINILESFLYLGIVVHNNSGPRQEVLLRIGLAHGVMY